jgi:type II secretory pathway predicted ATPase ExeA
MALKLKRLLEDHGISLADLAQGAQASKTTMFYVVNRGDFPKNDMEIKDRIVRYAKKRCFWSEDMFEPEKEKQMSIGQDAINFHGFSGEPFVNEITDDGDLYLTESATRSRKALVALIKSNGRALLCGKNGSGKTEIANSVLAEVQDAGVVVYKTFPENGLCQQKKLSDMNIVEGLMLSCGIESLPISREKRKIAFQNHLEHLARPILFVAEEAHAWHWSTLRTLKWFSERVVGRKSLMGLLLIGHESLIPLLDQRVPELGNRLTHIYMKPFSKPEAVKYLGHKLARAGNAHALPAAALEAVYERVGRDLQQPYPLVLNRTAATVLLYAMRVGEKNITAKCVLSA